jgi:hypothetical protein
VLTADIVRMQHRSETSGISVCLCFFIRRELQKKVGSQRVGEDFQFALIKKPILAVKMYCFLCDLRHFVNLFHI